MKCQKAYAIMSVGKKDVSAHSEQQKTPELRPLGFFYSVSGGWLKPKADYQLFVSVQPFADVVATTLAKTEKKKRCEIYS